MFRPLRNQKAALLMLAAIAVGGAAVPAQAQPDESFRIQTADTDGDGAISADEARAAAGRQFAQMDLNHDGSISQQEFVNARMALFKQADSDGDGRLTRGEIRARVLAMRQH